MGGTLGLLDQHHGNQIAKQMVRVLKSHSKDAQPNRTLERVDEAVGEAVDEAVGEAVGEAGVLKTTLAMQKALQNQPKKGKQTVLHEAASPKAALQSIYSAFQRQVGAICGPDQLTDPKEELEAGMYMEIAV